MFGSNTKAFDEQTMQTNGAHPGLGMNGGQNTIIGAGLKVTGGLRSAGDIRVDGDVQGDIAGRSVTVSEGARVEGDIIAETVHIAGSVIGHIDSISVTLARTARVVGNVTHNALSIEDGAVLDGLRPWRPPTGLIRTRVTTGTQ